MPKMNASVGPKKCHPADVDSTQKRLKAAGRRVRAAGKAEMQETGAPESTTGVVERVRQTAVANFQLLVMLEVVREWTRADAVDLAEAAEQTEAATVVLERLQTLDTATDERTGAQEQILKVLLKLDRLTQLAPVQSRDPAVVGAILEGLRRLRVANETAQNMLELGAPPADGGGLQQPSQV